jgi:hypothetical protein
MGFSPEETPMKLPIAIAIAGAVFATGIVPADAASKKNTATAQQEASCKAQAAKKFSAIHFMKRREFVNNCMGRVASTHKAKAKQTATAPKATPTTTGQGSR